MGKEYFKFEKDPQKRIGWITFNRPERLNIWLQEDEPYLAPLLREIEEDDDVKVLILKGEGECFGAGADVMMLGTETVRFERNAPPPSVKRRLLGERRMRRWCGDMGSDFGDFCKPCIAQVHGYCYGFHFHYAAAVDIVISSEECLFTHPAFRYITETWPAWAWMDQMGYKKFAELLLTGGPFTAQQMEQCGFINKVVPRDKLEDEVMELAAVIALQPYEMLLTHKHMLETLRAMRLPAGSDRVACLGHILSTYMRLEPGDFSILRDTTKKGASGAIDAREKRYPPKYRLSHSKRAAKE